jgi:hypothetical protein
VNAAGVALKPQTGPGASARRVGALIRRHAYLLLVVAAHRVDGVLPTVTMVLWAFSALPRADQQLPARRAGLLHRRGALWDVLFAASSACR